MSSTNEMNFQLKKKKKKCVELAGESTNRVARAQLSFSRKVADQTYRELKFTLLYIITFL